MAEEEIAITNIFGMLMQSFEELKKLFPNHPQNKRIEILSDAVIFYLTSLNPVKFIKEIIYFYQSYIARQKSVKYLSKRNNS